MKGKFCFGFRKAFSIMLSIVFLLGLAGNPAAQAQDSALAGLGQPGLSFRYVKTFGVTGEPYLPDGTHLNQPMGIFIDAADNLYVAETAGAQVKRFNASGVNTLTLGQAGMDLHHDNFLPNPQDITVDPDGNIWVLAQTMLKEFAPDGTVVSRFPDEDPWNSGEDNTHFRDARGLAFNAAGRLFVADSGNNRVQVYDVSTVPPTYVNTLGEAGVNLNDNTHFVFPSELAFDSQNALFVLDSSNFRVQKCTTNDNWLNWACSTFYDGAPGSDPTNGDMKWAEGLNIDGSDNVYITDGGKSRVLKCTPAGSCAHFAGTPGLRGSGNNVFGWAEDVATDFSGRVYVSDTDNRVIQQYSSTGTFIQNFAGTAGVPYVTDAAHINKPWGVVADSAGNIYVTENKGQRLLKYDASGVQQWTIGSPGNFIFGWNNLTADNQKFSDYWAGLEGSPAIDALGNIYVTDTGNHRVQVYRTSNGSYVTTMGVFREGGAANDRFSCPTGAAISPVNGDIYIADHCNQRVQVFTSSRAYKTTIGVPEEQGSDNAHLNYPWNVAVDKNGAVYIADTDNKRIQKCTLAGSVPTCSTFLGDAGISDRAFNHFNPLSLAVDAAGRVYVADEWNSRVQVFDSTGAYLTTIGGSGGQRNGELDAVFGVSVDTNGNVYIADRNNNRVEMYAPNVPGWSQTNINGFGDPENDEITRMSIHNGLLYASTQNLNSGGEVWRSAGGRNWGSVPVASGGFGNSANRRIQVGKSFNGYLYAGTENLDTGGEIWRCSTCSGSDWVKVLAGSVLGAGHNNVQTVSVHANALYATVNGENGLVVLRSTTGASGTWQQVNVSWLWKPG